MGAPGVGAPRAAAGQGYKHITGNGRTGRALDESGEATETPAAATGPRWAVQVGSFSSRANADALSEWCREQGYGWGW